MGLTQLNFDGKNKIEEAILLIQAWQPVEGYQLCLSAGGKDSQVAEDLTKRAGGKYTIVYNRTGIDPPEAIKFMRDHYPDVEIQKPVMSIWQGIEKKGLPRRQSRWCCELLKEYSGNNKVLITGIRAQESGRRKARCIVETNRRGNKQFIHPIFNWTTSEVWEYIKTNDMPYCELYDLPGWNRLGCVLCPFTTWRKTLNEWERYPKLAEAWFRAARRYWERMYPVWKEKGTANYERFPTPESLVWWWLTRGETTIENMKYQAAKRGLIVKF